MMLRRILPLVLVNMVVILLFTAVVIEYPKYVRFAALAMPLLFVFNFLYLRSQQRKYALAIATRKAAPPSPANKRSAMWALVLWGAASYISGALNIPELLQQHDFGPWLGWAVKITVGSLALWLAYKLRKNLQGSSSEEPQRQN
jgi:hypothetical protein